MKTALKSALTAIRRAFLLYQVRSLEIHLDGIDAVLEGVRDPLALERALVAKAIARRELARVRSEYVATLPPGRRVVWSAA